MISVHQLRKVFEASGRRTRERGDSSGQAHEIVAVDGVSFQVPPGEVYGLLGPNGAGKTTTLRMILGLLRPTSGYAEVQGVRSDQQPDEVKRKIGLVSASAGLYQWLTPREMLLFFADLYGIDPQTAEEELQRLIELLALGEFVDQRGSTLSTGQKQRVLLARALIHRPPIMLLDEPTRGLDVFGTQAVFDYIRLLREEGKVVIVSTHRLHEAQQLCDRFGLLHHGRMAMEGSLEELREATGQKSLAEMFMRFARDFAPSMTGGRDQ
ncbi:MAG: ATP-binding cassette domain-containing protein [Planctomycetaceae bacterium]